MNFLNDNIILFCVLLLVLFIIFYISIKKNRNYLKSIKDHLPGIAKKSGFIGNYKNTDFSITLDTVTDSRTDLIFCIKIASGFNIRFLSTANPFIKLSSELDKLDIKSRTGNEIFTDNLTNALLLLENPDAKKAIVKIFDLEMLGLYITDKKIECNTCWDLVYISPEEAKLVIDSLLIIYKSIREINRSVNI